MASPTFMDARGIAALVYGAKLAEQAGSQFFVIGTNRRAARVLAIAGADRVLGLAPPDEAEGAASLGVVRTLGRPSDVGAAVGVT